jgi:hypothetical protein
MAYQRVSRRLLRSAILGVAVVSVGCSGPPAWNENDYRSIYGRALESLRTHVGVDSLVVDPRTRFLIETDGSFRMDDFGMFGDPLFYEAVRVTALVDGCAIGPGADCSRAEHPRLATMSEIAVLGPREAGVLASYSNLESDPVETRALAIRLRFAGRAWRVVRIENAHEVDMRRGTK